MEMWISPPRCSTAWWVLTMRAALTALGSTASSIGDFAEGRTVEGRVSTSCRQAGELDLETVRSVRDYLSALAGRGVVDARSVAAWELFYAEYNPLVRLLSSHRCRNRFDVDDRVQEVWLAVAVHFLQYDPQRGSLATW